MKRMLLLWLTALPILIILDLTWTTGIASSFYRSQFGSLLTTQPKVIPIVLFYLIYSLGVVCFVVAPALLARSWRTLIFNAVLLGLVGYGTYDLISLGLNANWPTLVSIVDVCWGMVISTLTAGTVYLLAITFYRW